MLKEAEDGHNLEGKLELYPGYLLQVHCFNNL
jgi:hypothetical protein